MCVYTFVNYGICEHLLGGAMSILFNVPYGKHSINTCDCVEHFALIQNTYTYAKSQYFNQSMLFCFWVDCCLLFLIQCIKVSVLKSNHVISFLIISYLLKGEVRWVITYVSNIFAVSIFATDIFVVSIFDT